LTPKLRFLDVRSPRVPAEGGVKSPGEQFCEVTLPGSTNQAGERGKCDSLQEGVAPPAAIFECSVCSKARLRSHQKMVLLELHNPASFSAHGPTASFSAHGPTASFSAHGPTASFSAHGPTASFSAHGPTASFSVHGPTASFSVHGPTAFFSSFCLPSAKC
ncbi:hypothetical protein STEG23_003622, partial [Scotinomys teguina]